LRADLKVCSYKVMDRDREAESATAAVRLRSGEDLGARPSAEVIKRMHGEVEEERKRGSRCLLLLTVERLPGATGL